MKVAMVTVMAMTHGLARGRQVSWNEGVAAEASAGPFFGCDRFGCPVGGYVA
ncbi:MAG TPA: hypothetical protein VMQ56_06990 [Terracidiphilus sp.]|nr:hypothetical protein [Terracidiphilus sp.]